MGAGLAIVLIGLVVSILVQLGKLRLPSGGKTCRKCCSKIRKKKKTAYQLKREQENKTLQDEIEKSAKNQQEKDKKKLKIENQGKNDSFFAGEEFKNYDEINPNVDMGYQKFARMPNPDFIVQVLTEHYEEEMTLDKTAVQPAHPESKLEEVYKGDTDSHQLSSRVDSKRQEPSQHTGKDHKRKKDKKNKTSSVAPAKDAKQSKKADKAQTSDRQPLV